MSKESKERVDTLDLNIVIIPDTATAAVLTDISHWLAKHVASDFVLNDSEFRPHLSLFPNQYPQKNKATIESSLINLSKHSQPFRITLTGYSQISGFIFADAVKTDELVSLHSDAVEVLNPLREGHMPSLVADLKGLNPAQQASVEKYGNPIVLDSWEPHVTLTHINDIERAKQILEALPPINLEFDVAAIHLSRFARWGTCPEILESFPLGGNT